MWEPSKQVSRYRSFVDDRCSNRHRDIRLHNWSNRLTSALEGLWAFLHLCTPVAFLEV